MNLYSQNDTIAAISTPVGIGGIGVVRVSGEGSQGVIEKIFTSTLKEKRVPEFKANRIYYGWIYRHSEPTASCRVEESHGIECEQSLKVDVNIQDDVIDEVVLLCFKAPNSFTGEDVFEIQCHGGINVVKNILRLCLNSGARMAEQGEFSKRAFINGKLDLSKAEAVIDLIHAKTDRFSKVSAMNLSGRLAEKISNLRNELMTLLSVIIAAVDFPDEVDEPEYEFIQEKIRFLLSEIDEILQGSVSSNLMRHGINAAIAGKPNAGKSSLFNALLDMQRAIVTEIPGTTRDIITESIDIEGIPVNLIDTAGLRESDDYVESIGINLTKESLENADIVLYIHDLTQGFSQEDTETCEKIKNKLIKIGSKCDLAGNAEEDCIKISSKTGEGLKELKSAVKNAVFSGNVENLEFSTNLRQQECLKNCKDFLGKANEACSHQEAQDLISIDLKSALLCLGEITGEVVTEEIIDNIFSKFCIGK